MQRCIHPRGQTPPGRHKRAKKLFKCFQKCPSSKHQPPRARDALPVRAETCWPHAQGGRCCTFSLPQSSRSQVDFPTLSISTLTGVVSSHFPGEPLGGGGGWQVLWFWCCPRQDKSSPWTLTSFGNDIDIFGCWSVQPASRIGAFSPLSYQGFHRLSSESSMQPSVVTSSCAHL